MVSLNYYLNLVTSLYRTKPNYMTFLNMLLTPFYDCAVLLNTMYQSFDIDNAYGQQLDIIGDIVGLPRTLPFQPTDGSSATMNDPTYQVCLKAKIGLNQWKGQAGDIEALWATLFSTGAIIIEDNQDMTLTIGVGGVSISQIMRDLIRQGYIVPRPQGVQNRYFFSTPLPFFAYGIENQYMAGYGVGNWPVGDQDPPLFAFDVEDAQHQPFDIGVWD